MEIRKRNDKNNDIEKINKLATDLNISKILSSIIYNKGYDTVDKATQFLNPSFNQLYNPYLFLGMKNAIDKINYYIATKERIVVYGDFDVDGTMATTVLALELRRRGANISCYIPDRHIEGYGLNKDAIKKLAEEKGCKLLITVDCGITGKECVDYAYSLGMEVIITDHHEAPEELPNCVAIIDAKIPNQTYPFNELCGAGVAGKIVQALSGMDAINRYLDLIALATVADLVPLVDENRALVSLGLRMMNTTLRPGLIGLSKYAKGEKELINAYHLGFRYGPMINACGRLDNAANVVKLMTTSNMEVIEELSKLLYDLNEKRKNIEDTILNECLEMLEENPIEKRKGIVLYSNNWEAGVIGIVASRLVERYNCPVILLTYDKDKNNYHGSCRSVDGINIYDVLCKCSSNIQQFGGHKMAAGLSVKLEEIRNFSDKFLSVMEEYEDKYFEPFKIYDETLKVKDISIELVRELRMIEPCGLGNPKPHLLAKNVSFKDIQIRGKNREHFACLIYDETGNCESIAFKQKRPDEYEDLDVILTPGINNYNGKENVQCKIEFVQESKKHLIRNELSKITNYGVRIVDQDLQVIGITDRKIKQFNDAGIYTLKDLVNYLPRKYYDFRRPKNIEDIQSKEFCCVIGKVLKIKCNNQNVFATCIDQKGRVFMVSWFSQPYVYKQIQTKTDYMFCGTVNFTEDGFPMMNPKYWDRDIEKLMVLKPEYKKIKGMSSDYLEDCINKALKILPNTDYLEKDIVEHFSIISEYDATVKLHQPKSDIDIRDAQRRKVFDNLFRFNFILKDKLNDGDFDTVFKITERSIWKELSAKLPYNLTTDQQQALIDMFKYMISGKRLNSLVQGDVGTGKTIVAFFMMALAMENGFQSCIIAPTEVLARQHYEGLVELMEPFNVKVGYLVGGMKAKERRELLAGIKDGSIQMIVGTHAVIQDSVEFKELGLVVIDEQHRFGVAQRDKLLNAENKPHLITMSATPIPRTLSMALFGDHIQVFNIKTKPAGRKEIITQQIQSDEEINQFMLEEIRKGRQCYIVCPLIDESESETMSDVKSVNVSVEELIEYFKDYPEVKISNITGKMKQADINTEIEKFANLESNILISTTIIEVGVNVPNATVMVIKSSERFGLAQSHQLRGRVGRGSHQSYCILQTSKDDIKADILCSTSDGFEIAQQDLMLRGTGDYIGTQQTGNNKDVMLMMAEPDLYKEIGIVNDGIYSNPAKFAKYKYILEDYYKEKEDH